VTCKFLKT